MMCAAVCGALHDMCESGEVGGPSHIDDAVQFSRLDMDSLEIIELSMKVQERLQSNGVNLTPAQAEELGYSINDARMNSSATIGSMSKGLARQVNGRLRPHA